MLIEIYSVFWHMESSSGKESQGPVLESSEEFQDQREDGSG